MDTPTPAAGPLTAAITGTGGALVMARISEVAASMTTFGSAGGLTAAAARSAPVQNARPDPVMTMVRTAGSAPPSWTAAAKAVIVGRSIAFIRFGRSKVNRSTPSVISERKPVSAVAVMPRSQP